MATAKGKVAEQNPFVPSYELPNLEGYTDQSGDIAGYWNPEWSYMHFVPIEVTLFDNKIQANKPSALIIGELVDPFLLEPTGEDEEPVQAQAGARVGVWYGPGMRGIVALRGVPVLLAPNGLKDTGKPNDMKKYIVRSAKRGERLIATNDYRKESKSTPTPFDYIRTDIQGVQPRRASPPAISQEEDLSSQEEDLSNLF